jgi:hypothetical protein
MHRYSDVRILFKFTSISNNARKDERYGIMPERSGLIGHRITGSLLISNHLTVMLASQQGQIKR